MTTKVLICYQRQTLSIHGHFSSFLYLLSCHLPTDVEGSRSEERKDLGAQEYEGVKEGRKRVMKKALSHSVRSPQWGLLWSPCCLSYWPLGKRGTEHLCWIDRTTWSVLYLWMILNSLKWQHESQISVSYCHTSVLVHLFFPNLSLSLTLRSVCAAVTNL